ncbi:MAG: CBS domain-containing protein [Alphaproteobacteria bacterium]|nr:MAG: CBS domain-containing protein [Alphaproteobacteria bacterium]
MTTTWKNVCLPRNASIREAMQVIDAGHLRIALLVGDQLELLGVVTDGDIRRAYISNRSFDDPALSVATTKPFTARQDEPRDRWLDKLVRNSLVALPIVDAENRVVGLETIHSFFERPQLENPVFLMAGGFGTRLQPLTENCPKPMLPIGGKPILEIIIESFIEQGFRNFFISTHYMPELIRNHFQDGSRWGVSVRYVHEERPLGTGGALGLLPRDVPDMPIVMMNGDILTKANFVEMLGFHQSKNAAITVAVRKYNYQIPYGVLEIEDLTLTGVTEKPVISHFVNAGIYIISPEIRDLVAPDTRIDITDVISDLVDRGKTVATFPLHESWIDIGDHKEFNRARKQFEAPGAGDNENKF